MLTKAAYVFGVVFVVIGLLGFVPAAAPDGMLLGLFHVNALHNIIHLATGVVALFAGYYHFPKYFFQLFGVIYAVVALLGFWYGAAPILGIVANNMADAVLHVVIAATALYLGFCCKCCCSCEHKNG